MQLPSTKQIRMTEWQEKERNKSWSEKQVRRSFSRYYSLFLPPRQPSSNSRSRKTPQRTSLLLYTAKDILPYFSRPKLISSISYNHNEERKWKWEVILFVTHVWHTNQHWQFHWQQWHFGLERPQNPSIYFKYMRWNQTLSFRWPCPSFTQSHSFPIVNTYNRELTIFLIHTVQFTLRVGLVTSASRQTWVC